MSDETVEILISQIFSNKDVKIIDIIVLTKYSVITYKKSPHTLNAGLK